MLGKLVFLFLNACKALTQNQIEAECIHSCYVSYMLQFKGPLFLSATERDAVSINLLYLRGLHLKEKVTYSLPFSFLHFPEVGRKEGIVVGPGDWEPGLIPCFALESL